MTSKIQEAAEKYADENDIQDTDDGCTFSSCERTEALNGFTAGANFMLEESNAKIAKLTEALKQIEPILSVGRDDFEQLRVMKFNGDFNVHEIDTAWIIASEALKSCEQYDEQTLENV